MKKIVVFLLLLTLYGNLTGQTYTMPISGIMTASDCYGTLFDSGGPLGSYTNGESGVFIIQSPNSEPITLSFIGLLSIEQSFEFLTIIDGVQGETIATFNAPSDMPNNGEDIVIPSGIAEIHFSSDFSVVFDGFQIEWTLGEGSSNTIVTYEVSDAFPALLQQVHFENTTTNEGSFMWDFGDGSSSTEESPDHSYVLPGVYEVNMTYFSCNIELAADPQWITVQVAPTISINPNAVNLSLSIGDTEEIPMSISNTGEGELLYDLSIGNSSPVPNFNALFYDYRADLNNQYIQLLDNQYSFFVNTLSLVLSTNVSISKTQTNDPALMASLLKGKDLFIIPERPFYDLAAFANLSPVINEFVMNGGQVIILKAKSDIVNAAENILNTLGFFQSEYNGYDSSINTNNSNNVYGLLQGVNIPALDEQAAETYHFNDGSSLINLVNGSSVMAMNRIGYGLVYYIGIDLNQVILPIATLRNNLFELIEKESYPIQYLIPDYDIIPSSQSINDLIKINADQFYSGISYLEFLIGSNDVNNLSTTIPFTIQLVPSTSFEVSTNNVDFGTIINSTTAIQYIELINSGNLPITISDLDIPNNNFSISNVPITMLPFSSVLVPVYFSSISNGAHTSTLTLQGININTVINLSGNVAGQPMPTLDPQSISVTLDGGTQLGVPITISNSGVADLNYYYLDQTIQNSAGVLLNFSSSFNFFDDYQLVLTDEMTDQIVETFEPPYLIGNNVNEFEITNLNPEHTYRFSINNPSFSCHITNLLVTGLYSGEVILDILVPCTLEFTTAPFAPDDNVMANWLSMNPLNGQVAGSSAGIFNAIIDATQLIEGIYQDTIIIQTNSPSFPLLYLPVEANVIGHPDIELNTNELDFGQVMENTSSSLFITVENTGSGYLQLTDFIFDNDSYMVNGGIFSIPPHQSQNFEIIFSPEYVGNFGSNLTIHSNADTLYIPLYGFGIGAPQVSAIPGSINVTLSPDEIYYGTLNLWNLGLSDLSYQVVIEESGEHCGIIFTYKVGNQVFPGSYSWNITDQSSGFNIGSGPPISEQPGSLHIETIENINCNSFGLFLQAFLFGPPPPDDMIWEFFTITDLVSGVELFNGSFISAVSSQVFATIPPLTSENLYGWFSMDIDSTGIIGSQSPLNLQYTINSEGLSPGVYNNAIIFTTNDPMNPEITVPISLTVIGDVEAIASASNDAICSEELIQFVDSSTNGPTSWQWNFGDGTTSTLQNPVHEYETSGSYDVILTACNDNGCDQAPPIPILVDMECGAASIPYDGNLVLNTCQGFIYDSGGPTGDYLPMANGSVTIDIPGATGILLSFSEFEYEEVFDELIIYSGPSTDSPILGIYGYDNVPTTVFVLGSSATIQESSDANTQYAGFEVSYSCAVEASVPTTDFSYISSTICPGLIAFNDQSQNLPSTWSWDFGDGSFSTQKNPENQYTSPGVYNVELTACNDMGCNTSTQEIVVTNNTQEPVFPTYAMAMSDISFNTGLQNVSTWLWDFGDGSNSALSTEATPIHTYAEPGQYNISLSVVDALNPECLHTYNHVITIGITGLSSQLSNDEDGQVKIFPNPAANNVKLIMPVLATDITNLTVDIIDYQGKLCMSHKASIVASDGMELDISSLANGLYILQVNADDRWYIGKLLIAH